MPPSRHSHSSHSSHSHHSSHSSHSHSSHSSSSHYGGGRSSSVYSGHLGFTKVRTNQPKNYGKSIQRTKYKGSLHEYIHFDQGWTDEQSGIQYPAGYYDEDGRYYRDVAFLDGEGLFTADCVCEYCGTKAKVRWKVEVCPACPNCGAALDIVNIPTDKLLMPPTVIDDATESINVRSRMKSFTIMAFSLVVCTVISVIGSVIPMILRSGHSQEPELYRGSYEDTPAVQNTDIYGDKLKLMEVSEGVYKLRDEPGKGGKSLSWDYGYQSYYDKESDCYLWYNTDVAPNLWQYWYEGISSDYGDYGWMEYEDFTDDDIDNGTWYIEVRDGDWVELPDKYDTSKLWHIMVEFD